MYKYKAICTEVIDGDTIHVSWIDLGFHISVHDIRLRLNRINAPETRTTDKKEEKRGEKSKKYLKDLIENTQIIIQTSKQDSFGRYLAELWKNDENLNDKLVEEGLAEYKQY